MQINIATKEDLESLKASLLDEVKKMLESKVSTPKPWLRTKEARDLLNVSAGTLGNHRSKGLLHPKKIGGILYYSYEEIQKLMNPDLYNHPQ